MTDTTTEQDYRNTVLAYAKDALDRSRDGEELPDVIHELVNNSCWIIYDWRARLVCKWSKNEDACFDVLGNLRDVSSASELWLTVAFYAMEADVTQAWGELAAVEDDEDDEEGEEEVQL